MFGFKSLLTIAMGICFAQNLAAQQHEDAWFRSTLSMQMNAKIKFDTEFQHRRQNGFQNGNRFANNLMFSYRNWVHYQLNRNVRFSLSPFAYFSNYKIIEKPDDAVADPKSEFRFSAAADLQQELFNKFYITARTAAEYRIIEKQANMIRLRNRLGTMYKVNDGLKLGFYDEVLLNVQGTSINHFFDHNRIAVSVADQILPGLNIEADCMKVSRLPLSGNATLRETNLLLQFTYTIGR